MSQPAGNAEGRDLPSRQELLRVGLAATVAGGFSATLGRGSGGRASLRLANTQPNAITVTPATTIATALRLTRNLAGRVAGFSDTSSGAGSCVISDAASKASASSPSSRAYLRRCPFPWTGAPRLASRPASSASIVLTPTCSSAATCCTLRPRRSLSAFSRCPGAVLASGSIGLPALSLIRSAVRRRAMRESARPADTLS